MKYVMRRKENGIWDCKMLRLDFAQPFLVMIEKCSIQTLSEGLNQRGPKVFHDSSSNYSFDVQASPLKRKIQEEIEFLRLLHILLGS